jgi:hypothetical protein
MHNLLHASRRGIKAASIISATVTLAAAYKLNFFRLPKSPTRIIGPHEDFNFTPFPPESDLVTNTIKLLQQFSMPAAGKITSIASNNCNSMCILRFSSAADVAEIRELSSRLTKLGIDNTCDVDSPHGYTTLRLLVGLSELHHYLSEDLLKKNQNPGTLIHPLGA